MEFTNIEFFIEVCNKGFTHACDSFKIGKNDALYTLKDLQSYIGFELFIENSTPSYDNLTQNGIAFLPHCKKIIDDISDGILSVCEETKNDNVLIISSTFSYGKTIILPCVLEIGELKEFSDLCIDLITYGSSASYKSDILNTHLIFHEMARNDYMFFDKRWSVRIDQGLYASEEYLKDIGNIPKTPEDLKMHSILARGEFFDCESYKDINWHLSGIHGLCELEPSIMISSQTVLSAAVEANLGIGPVANHHCKLSQKKLVRILPEIKGPGVVIDFAVKKRATEHLRNCIDELESIILKKIEEIGLEIIY